MMGETTESEEQAADWFARDMLIKPADYKKFVEDVQFNEAAIIEFAKKANIDPGIVVGRLQKENHIKYNQLNHLKTRYKIAG